MSKIILIILCFFLFNSQLIYGRKDVETSFLKRTLTINNLNQKFFHLKLSDNFVDDWRGIRKYLNANFKSRKYTTIQLTSYYQYLIETLCKMISLYTEDQTNRYKNVLKECFDFFIYLSPEYNEEEKLLFKNLRNNVFNFLQKELLWLVSNYNNIRIDDYKEKLSYIWCIFFLSSIIVGKDIYSLTDNTPWQIAKEIDNKIAVKFFEYTDFY